jgi:hypothetical protein
MIQIHRFVADARKNLAKSLLLYRRQALSVPARDHESVMLRRFAALDGRIGNRAGVIECRRDAEEHRQLLRLPQLVWPTEWPMPG